MTKPIGWFSRRHRTSEAHLTAQHAKEERIAKWDDTIHYNAQDRAKRSPQQQLDELDARLGKEIGAKKERKALKAQIK